MNSESSNKTRIIFNAAAAIEDAAEQAKYLEHACGNDADLRAEIEGLLSSDREAGDFLDSPVAVLSPTMETNATEQPGTYIGPYKLVEEIGEGGMGAVFMALQKKPVRRTVALKIIKPGMDSKQVVSRFEAERQALAVMDHPNIAKVHDGGTTESGRPYFVMELVKGIPITEYCDGHRLTNHERLELFQDVCSAVHHAHQKGIIHRDLKPSNVLVTQLDGKPLPKIIDFGIAKAISGHLVDESFVTGFSQLVGTPMYMSPEQAELTASDVDTRSDVYSLGVLLYELLTGVTPFDRDRMSIASFDEVRRIVQEEDPPRPSTRLSTLDAALETVAEKHHTDVRTLSNEVRGELDWIVMKALEKNRSRRYEGASELAKDIQRYLDGAPVHACPPSRAYLARKYVHRNWGLLTVTAIVAMAVLFGTAVAAWQAARAIAAAQALEEQKAEAQRQQHLAQDNFRMARAAVDEYSTIVTGAELEDLRQTLLDASLKYYQQFIQLEGANDPVLRRDIASAYLRLGDITRSLNYKQEAASTYELAVKAWSALANDVPEDQDLQSVVAESYFRLGTVLRESHRRIEAIDSYQQAAIIWESAPKDVDENRVRLADTYRWLSGLHRALEMPAEAVAYSEKAAQVAEQLAASSPESIEHVHGLVDRYIELGNAYHHLGDEQSARQTIRTNIGVCLSLLSGPLDGGTNAAVEAEVCMQLCLLYAQSDKPVDAIKYCVRAIEIRETLALRDRRYRGILAESYTVLAQHQLQFQSQKHSIREAEENLRRAVVIFEQLAKEKPDAGWELNVSERYYLIGELHSRWGELEQALPAFLKAVEYGEILVEAKLDNFAFRAFLSKCYQALGATQLDLGDPVKAQDSFQTALDLRMKIPRETYSAADWGYLGLASYGVGKWKDARHAIERGLQMRGETEPTSSGGRWWYLALSLAGLGETDEAGRIYDHLVAEIDTHEKVNKEHERLLDKLAELLELK